MFDFKKTRGGKCSVLSSLRAPTTIPTSRKNDTHPPDETCKTHFADYAPVFAYLHRVHVHAGTFMRLFPRRRLGAFGRKRPPGELVRIVGCCFFEPVSSTVPRITYNTYFTWVGGWSGEHGETGNYVDTGWSIRRRGWLLLVGGSERRRLGPIRARVHSKRVGSARCFRRFRAVGARPQCVKNRLSRHAIR